MSVWQAVPRRASPTGDIVERIRLGAYALCERDDALLLVRVAPGEPGEGHWTLPGGGVEFGEHPEAGMLRELEEETGYLGEVVALAGLDDRLYEPEITVSGHRVHAIRIVYRVAIVGGELRHEVGGSTDTAAWIPRAAITALPVIDLVPYALTLLTAR